MPTTFNNRFRYTLTVPVETNSGQRIENVHETVENALVSTFGGFTVTDSIGAWRDDSTDRIYRERVRVYTVDTDAENAGPSIALLASYVQRAAAQESVYVTRQSIETAYVVA